jgi:protease YdgD
MRWNISVMRRASTGLAAAGCALLVGIATNTAKAEMVSPKPTPKPTGILGSTDHRIPVSPTVWPWSSVGRVNVVFGPADRSHCTGTLVGPRHVLTAAHCFFSTRLKSLARPGQIHFVAGQARDGKFAGYAPAASLAINPAFDFAIEPRPGGNRLPAGMLQHDWAILRLAMPMSLRPVPVRVIRQADLPGGDERGEIARAGYSRDRPFALSMHRGCSLKTDAPATNMAMHRCDSMPGDSGSPILLLHQDAAALVAIHTAIQSRFVPGAGHRAEAAFGVAASAFAAAVEAAEAAVTSGE